MSVPADITEFDEVLGRACNAVGHASAVWNASAGSQPVHTVYGGAHLFAADTITKLQKLASKSFHDYAPNIKSFIEAFQLPDARLAAVVYERLVAVLNQRCVQDFRIDFEDGFGYRSDEDEDRAAVLTAEATAKAAACRQLPGSFGIRVKPINEKSGRRAIATLKLYIDALARFGGAQAAADNFVVTLPKVVLPEQVAALSEILSDLERRINVPVGSIKIEFLVEHPLLFSNHEGRCVLADVVSAANGRCRGAHLGAYDYTCALGIVGSAQRLDHFACDQARALMQIALSPTGVWLSDGATNSMPIPQHRGTDNLSTAQMEENTATVHRAWRHHFLNVTRALDQGIFQGWDLHPAQIPARYAALHTFFLSALPEMASRIRAFADNAARATLCGSSFDDLATGRALFSFFERATASGAIVDADLAMHGLSASRLSEMRTLLT